ncbi:MAG: hypothetical protein CL424_03195 [Acidimicrobiaceae bacterium]|nr:hypothetical protein [Acidimicrobiaceae bacterium]
MLAAVRVADESDAARAGVCQDEDMGVIVLVANETLGGADLRAVVEDRVAAGPREFHVVVPVRLTLPPTIASGMAGADVVMIGDLDLPDERDVAADRLEAGLAWLREAGNVADGEIALSDAVRTLTDLVDRIDVSEIIVSTLPSRISRWLRQDLPSRICRAVEVPVTVVTAVDDTVD